MMYNPSDRTAASLNFSDIQVGHQVDFSHAVNQQDVDTFAALTGDFNPIHTDPEFARTTAFGKPIVHGMLTSSFISTMIGMLLPGRGALWSDQTLQFTRPVFVGDTITVAAEVAQVSVATRTMILDIKITNQNDHLVVVGRSTVQLMEGVTSEEAAAEKRKQEKKAATKATKKQPARDGGVVLVTGASGGIGAACVKSLAAEGRAVAVNFHTNRTTAEALVSDIAANGGRGIAVEADVSQHDQVEAMFNDIESRLGAVGGLVHTAAPEPEPRAFADTGWPTFEQTLSTQVGGAYHCVSRALPGMLSGNGGSIVLIGSIYGDSAPPAQQSAYVTAKSALSGLARALAVELGPKGIRVNVVAPGMTQTAMIANLPKKAKALAEMNTPLRRLADPQDVADAVAFLIGDQARHITGETLHVSGGVTMG